MATLDQVSAGRIGWNAVTGSSKRRRHEPGLERRPARARHALRHGRRVHGGRAQSSGIRGSRVRSSPTVRAACLWITPRVHGRQFPGQVFQHAWAAQLGPRAAGPTGDRPGRRLVAGPAICGHPCRHDRREPPRASTAMRRPTATTCTSTSSRKGRRPEQCKVLFLVNPILGETMEEGPAGGKRKRAAIAIEKIPQRLAQTWQYFQHRLRPLRPSTRPLPDDVTRERQHDGPSRSFRAMAAGRSIRETMVTLNCRRPFGGAGRHARCGGRADGRSDAGRRRRRLSVHDAQRQPPHPSRDRGRPGARATGSRPDGARRTSTSSSATIFSRS